MFSCLLIKLQLSILFGRLVEVVSKNVFRGRYERAKRQRVGLRITKIDLYLKLILQTKCDFETALPHFIVWLCFTRTRNCPIHEFGYYHNCYYRNPIG